MNILPIIKAGSDLIVSMGSGAIITNAVKATTPADLKPFQKVTIGVGAFVLSSMVGGAASQYSSSKIDETADQLKNAAEAVKDAKEKQENN